jgi:hypothetical protein
MVFGSHTIRFDDQSIAAQGLMEALNTHSLPFLIRPCLPQLPAKDIVDIIMVFLFKFNAFEFADNSFRQIQMKQ